MARTFGFARQQLDRRTLLDPLYDAVQVLLEIGSAAAHCGAAAAIRSSERVRGRRPWYLAAGAVPAASRIGGTLTIIATALIDTGSRWTK
jgi:hypothetical protein